METVCIHLPHLLFQTRSPASSEARALFQLDQKALGR